MDILDGLGDHVVHCVCAQQTIYHVCVSEKRPNILLNFDDLDAFSCNQAERASFDDVLAQYQINHIDAASEILLGPQAALNVFMNSRMETRVDRVKRWVPHLNLQPFLHLQDSFGAPVAMGLIPVNHTISEMI